MPVALVGQTPPEARSGVAVVSKDRSTETIRSVSDPPTLRRYADGLGSTVAMASRSDEPLACLPATAHS